MQHLVKSLFCEILLDSIISTVISNIVQGAEDRRGE